MSKIQFARLGEIFSRRPLAIAVISGLLAVIFGAAYLKGREADVLKIAEPVDVVVARKNIEQGEMINMGLIEIVKVPRRFVQPGAFSGVNDAAGRVAFVPIPSGAHVTDAVARRVGDIGGLSALIPTGFRAYVLDVSLSGAAAKFIRPGDFVDVLASFDLGSDSQSRRTTMTVVENARVLAVGERIADAVLDARRPEKSKGLFGSPTSGNFSDARVSIAVAVLPMDAQTLAFVSASGTVSVALRPFGDDGGGSGTGPTTIGTITGGHEELMPSRKFYREYKGR